MTVDAMELVALDLKRGGKFLARTLSYEGVEFRRVRAAGVETTAFASCHGVQGQWPRRTTQNAALPGLKWPSDYKAGSEQI